ADAELDAVAEVELLDQAPIRRLARPEPSRDDEPHGQSGIDQRKRLECEIDTLVGPNRAEAEEEKLRIPVPPALRRDRGFLRGRGEVGCDEAGMERVHRRNAAEAERRELAALAARGRNEAVRVTESRPRQQCRAVERLLR